MTWEYQELLNQNIQIIFVLAIGATAVHFKIFRQDVDLQTFNRFVFLVLLPSSVFLGLGIRSDLRDGALWRFVGGFLMMRALCLAGTCIVFSRHGVGVVTANWLFISWVSTVILGVPLVRAALGAQYSNLGVVAGISSFIFQLPVMLILFEIHSGKKVLDGSPELIAPGPATPSTTPQEPSNSNENIDISIENLAKAQEGEATVQTNRQEPPLVHRWITRTQAKSILRQLLHNPILWSIFLGIIFSATTLGPRYLNPGTPPAQPNCDYVVETGFIFLFFSSFAACTEPVALFATGMFLYHKNPLSTGRIRVGLYMLVKLTIVPALMVGCAAAVGLEGAPARAAVLLASLPISAAAFTLSDRYKICSEEAVANIFWGNLLVLPTTIAWMAFMDAVDLFPMQKGPTPDVCAAKPAAAG